MRSERRPEPALDVRVKAWRVLGDMAFRAESLRKKGGGVKTAIDHLASAAHSLLQLRHAYISDDALIDSVFGNLIETLLDLRA